MDYDPQSFTAPDGTEMIVLSCVDFDRLLAAAHDEDARDIEAARAALKDRDGFLVPHDVVLALLDGAVPIAAWRVQRGWSRARLATSIGQSQSAISRLERKTVDDDVPFGRISTRCQIAAALEVPLWAPDPLPD